MKRILSLLLAAVMLFGTVGVLSGCGKKDAEIRIYLGDQIYDFDPALAFVDDNVNRVMSLIFEPLFLMGENGKVKGGLAKDYKIIEDEEKGLYQMEITLRETYWNDGKNRVDADDIYFAWTRILDSSFPSQAAPLLYDIKNAVAVKQENVSRNELGLEANKDVLTITFEGKIDYDAFLRNLTSVALSPVRQNKLGDAVNPGESYWAKRTSYIATNGVFAIRSWDRGSGEFTLQRNEYYHVSEPEEGNKTEGTYPSLLATEWTNGKFEEKYDDMNDFLTDMFKNFGPLAEKIEDAVFCVGALPLDKELRTTYFEDAVTKDAFSTYSYIFNTKNPIFANENVRRALSLVIDREALAEELVFAKAADGLISPAVWDSVKKKNSFRSASEALIATKANKEEAERLLADVDTNQTIRLTVRNTPEEVMIANHVQEKWEELGFTVQIKAVLIDDSIWAQTKGQPGRTVNVGSGATVYDDAIQAAYTSGEFDVLGVDYNMYSTNAFTALCGFSTAMNGNGLTFGDLGENGETVTENRLHCSGFSDVNYDALIDAAFAEKDLEKRAVILHQAEKYLLEKMPIAPLLYNQNYYLVEDIGGLDFDGYGNPVFTEARLKANIPEAPAKKDED